MQVLTNSEKLLLSSVGIFAVSLTAIVIFCVVKKSCWLHKTIWQDEKKKKKKQRMDDIICIRYPPDIYPTSLGVYRENVYRSPEEELARLFNSPIKRDSTYSSMSDTSSGYEISSPHETSGSNTTSSPITATVSTPESPDHANNANNSSSSMPTMKITSPQTPIPIGQDRRLSFTQLGTGATGQPIITNRMTAAAIAAEAAIAANQRFSLQNVALNQPTTRQPFFTFLLKYEEDNGLVNIEFIEARNLPPKEYINQPSDVFFTLEIQPKKPADRKKEMMRYRFVTKTIKKAGEICDFSEKFLAQLAKVHLKEYILRFSAFDQDRFGNPTEIGTTTLSFDDFRDFTINKLVLSCSLKETIMKRGDMMVGMCYLPTAERMSVTIVKLNNLNPYFNDGTITKQSICYVRLLLLRADSGKVIRKKKTTFQKLSGSTANQPVFNETIVFDMPPTELIQTVLLLLVCLTDKPPVPKGRREESSTSVPEGRDKNQNPMHHALSNKVSDESLFHFSDNLNKAKRTESQGSSSSSQSRSSAASSRHSGSNVSNRKPSDPSPAEGLKPDTSASNSPQSTSSTSFESGGIDKSARVKDSVIGKVALGYCIRNPVGKYHWENMMRVPRNVVTEWHSLK